MINLSTNPLHLNDDNYKTFPQQEQSIHTHPSTKIKTAIDTNLFILPYTVTHCVLGQLRN